MKQPPRQLNPGHEEGPTHSAYEFQDEQEQPSIAPVDRRKTSVYVDNQIRRGPRGYIMGEEYQGAAAVQDAIRRWKGRWNHEQTRQVNGSLHIYLHCPHNIRCPARVILLIDPDKQRMTTWHSITRHAPHPQITDADVYFDANLV